MRGLIEHLRETVSVSFHRPRWPEIGPWGDGPPYYTVLWLVTVEYSPWEARPWALDYQLRAWRLRVFPVYDTPAWWFAVGRSALPGGLRLVTPLVRIVITPRPEDAP